MIGRSPGEQAAVVSHFVHDFSILLNLVLSYASVSRSNRRWVKVALLWGVSHFLMVLCHVMS